MKTIHFWKCHRITYQKIHVSFSQYGGQIGGGAAAAVTYLIALTDDVMIFLVGIQSVHWLFQQDSERLVRQAQSPSYLRQQTTQTQPDVGHAVVIQAEQCFGKIVPEERARIQLHRHRTHVNVQTSFIEASTLCEICTKQHKNLRTMIN